MPRIKFLGRDPDGRYRYERWVRERPSPSNSGGWVPEEWTEDSPLPDVNHEQEKPK